MEKETPINKEMLLPSSLINDIEYDELDKDLQLIEGNKIHSSNNTER